MNKRICIVVLLWLVAMLALWTCGCEYMTPKWGTTRGPSVQVEKVQAAAPTEKKDVETVHVRIKRAGGIVVEEERVPLTPAIGGKIGTTSGGETVYVPAADNRPIVTTPPTKPARPWWDWMGVTQGCKGPAQGGVK